MHSILKIATVDKDGFQVLKQVSKNIVKCMCELMWWPMRYREQHGLIDLQV